MLVQMQIGQRKHKREKKNREHLLVFVCNEDLAPMLGTM